MNLKPSITSQYLAALEMLKQVVAQCPPELWNAPEHKNKFWNIAYHALVYTHFYLHPTSEDFQPWEHHRQEARHFEPTEDGQEKQPYTQAEILDYLALVEESIPALVDALALEAESGFSWLPFNKFELQFYNLRHLVLHTGELAERLWQSAGKEVGWVGMRTLEG